MPLYAICQCCKCKKSVSQDLWSISRDHKYSGSRYVCEHFDVDIDHESRIGFGFNWRNTITISAYYKPNYESRVIINRTFKRNDTEFQDYVRFSNKAVFHARVSDYRGQYPSCGYNAQNDIDYNESREQERREQKRKEEEQKRKEEEQKKINEIIESKKMNSEEKTKQILIILDKKNSREEITSNLVLNQISRTRNIREIFDIDKEFNLSKDSHSSQISTDNE